MSAPTATFQAAPSTPPALPSVGQRAEAPTGVRTLLWLKSREFLGEDRRPLRLQVLAGLVLLWFVLSISAIIHASEIGRLTPEIDLRYFTAASWALWALVPLLGGGSEVVAAQRLAPYPVPPRAIFHGSWAVAFLGLPYLVAFPMVAGLALAYNGLAGLALAVAFVAGSSAMGQLAAWTSSYLLTGRKRTGLASLALTGSVVGGLAIAPVLLGGSLRLGAILPGGWAYGALYRYHYGELAPLLQVGGAFLLITLFAYLIGPRIAAAAIRRESQAKGVGSRAWGERGWAARGGALRLLATTSVRSTFRAVGAQVAVVGVLAVPTLSQLPGFEIAQINLIAMAAIAGLAAATVLGVNSFAFDSGGAAMTLSLPVRVRDILIGKALAVGSLLLLAQLLATFLGALVLRVPLELLVENVILCFGRTFLLTGVSLCWSVWQPSASDYDSLRARIAAPGSILTFIPTAGLCCLFVSTSASILDGLSGAMVTNLLAACLALLLFRLAQRQLEHDGRERVALGAAG